MKINNSNIHFASQRLMIKRYEAVASLQAWPSWHRPDVEGGSDIHTTPAGESAVVAVISPEARTRLAEATGANLWQVWKQEQPGDGADNRLDTGNRLIKLVVERLTGSRVRQLSLGNTRSENSSVDAEGVVTTVDGREFDFKFAATVDERHTGGEEKDGGTLTLENDSIEGSYYYASDGPSSMSGEQNSTSGQTDVGVNPYKPSLALSAAPARLDSNNRLATALPTGRLSV